MSSSRSKFSRRAFLSQIGASAAMIPVLGSSRARAATGPRRLVVMTWPNGIHPPEFWPQGTETDFTFGQILSPMNDFKKDMLILGGLDQAAFIGQFRPADMRTSDAGWGHDDYLTLLTGARFAKYELQSAVSGGDSVDQVVADALEMRQKMPFHSLQVGARTGSGFQSCISARANTSGITPEADPVRLWKKLFEGRSLPGPTLDKLRIERRSVLDFLGRDIEAFGKNMGTDNRIAIESHLSAIRGLEKQVQGDVASAGCTAPTQPGTMNFSQNENFPALVRLQMDLIVTALKCDLTRVVTYNLTNTGGSGVIFSWLGADYTGKGDEYPNRDHHDIAHMQGRSAAHLQRYVGVNKWYYEQFAYFVRSLATIKEGDSRLLDNSAVLITNLTGSNHMATSLPFVVVGSCGGQFKTGRLLKYGAWAGKTGEYWRNKGIAHNQLLVSLANAMDVPIKQIGSKEFPEGPLPGLTA